MGAAHGHELPYLFDLAGHHLLRTPAQEALADQLSGYWSNFVQDGDRNGPGLPRWHPMRAHAGADREPYVQALESGSGWPGQVDLSAGHNCELWRTIPSG